MSIKGQLCFSQCHVTDSLTPGSDSENNWSIFSMISCVALCDTWIIVCIFKKKAARIYCKCSAKLSVLLPPTGAVSFSSVALLDHVQCHNPGEHLRLFTLWVLHHSLMHFMFSAFVFTNALKLLDVHMQFLCRQCKGETDHGRVYVLKLKSY